MVLRSREDVHLPLFVLLGVLLVLSSFVYAVTRWIYLGIAALVIFVVYTVYVGTYSILTLHHIDLKEMFREPTKHSDKKLKSLARSSLRISGIQKPRSFQDLEPEHMKKSKKSGMDYVNTISGKIMKK